VNAQAIQEAIAYRGSFNVIHLETMFKVDIFQQPQNSPLPSDQV